MHKGPLSAQSAHTPKPQHTVGKRGRRSGVDGRSRASSGRFPPPQDASEARCSGRAEASNAPHNTTRAAGGDRRGSQNRQTRVDLGETTRTGQNCQSHWAISAARTRLRRPSAAAGAPASKVTPRSFATPGGSRSRRQLVRSDLHARFARFFPEFLGLKGGAACALHAKSKPDRAPQCRAPAAGGKTSCRMYGACGGASNRGNPNKCGGSPAWKSVANAGR